VFCTQLHKVLPEISFNSNVTDQGMTEILVLISQLGNHYNTDFRMDARLNIEVDELLTTYYNGHYDITEIMKNVRMQERTAPYFEYNA